LGQFQGHRPESASGPIRLAVLGAARNWSDRYRPVLERRREIFKIVGIHDTVAQRATVEAARFRTDAVLGMRSLIARPEVDALLAFTDGWTRTMALRFAAESTKPTLALVAESDLPAIVGEEVLGLGRLVFDLPSESAPIEAILDQFARYVRHGEIEDLRIWDDLVRSGTASN
jgi:hypothetical protein